eukprot:3797795-Heterocapsa_arctica.AAC.1
MAEQESGWTASRGSWARGEVERRLAAARAAAPPQSSAPAMPWESGDDGGWLRIILGDTGARWAGVGDV